MCKYAYEKMSDRTHKIMIFCRMNDKKTGLGGLCVSQKFCSNKDKYVPINQKRDCKYFE